ncbi:hypothetical protein [uncultured Bacteroides sp.]|uniref:hypothetical protein n=1 Tax=uncultured Bacteroides sp. TaxID=162156 RepID=UPI0025857BA5|nr:hypothetical protein [uncultured Bacteroides sp.]
MREMKYLKVSADIARRAGVIDVRHRTADGDFIVNESDLRMVRFEPEEYVRGIAGQVLTEQEAARLIEAGGNQIGEEVLNEESNELPVENSLPSQDSDKESVEEDNPINGKEVQDE